MCPFYGFEWWWKNIIQERFDRETPPAHWYTYLYTSTSAMKICPRDIRVRIQKPSWTEATGTLRHRLSGHTSISRVHRYTDLVGCVCARTHLKKGLVPYSPVSWGPWQIPQQERCDTVYQDTLWLAVFVGTRIWSGVSWFRWQSVKPVWQIPGIGRAKIGILEPQGAVPPGSNPHRFIAWRLRCLFLGNADRALDIFVLVKRVWVTSLRLEPPKTRPCATIVRLMECTTNTNATRMSDRTYFLRSSETATATADSPGLLFSLANLLCLI